jgi:hypothetical protein
VIIPKTLNGKNKTFFFFGFQRLHERKSRRWTRACRVSTCAGAISISPLTTGSSIHPRRAT